jgi:hypothetical protein
MIAGVLPRFQIKQRNEEMLAGEVKRRTSKEETGTGALDLRFRRHVKPTNNPHPVASIPKFHAA